MCRSSRRFWEPEGVLQPPQIGFGRTTNEYYHGNPAVEFVNIGGPYGASAHGDSPSRRKIFICTPEGRGGSEEAMRHEDSVDARHARLPPPGHARKMSRRCSVFTGPAARKRISTRASRRAWSASWRLRAFCSASKRVPPNVAAGSAYRLSDLDLASRLSFFLWSSIPDDELLNAGHSRAAARSESPGAAGAAHAARSPVAGAGGRLRQSLART